MQDEAWASALDTGRKQPRDDDEHLHQLQHLIEQFFDKLRQYRSLATARRRLWRPSGIVDESFSTLALKEHQKFTHADVVGRLADTIRTTRTLPVCDPISIDYDR